MVQKDINVYWLSLLSDTPKRGFWDQGIIEDLLSDFTHHEVDHLSNGKFGIVVVPARSHKDMVVQVNAQLSCLKSAIVILTGDEEGEFPVEKLSHPHLEIWIQNPMPKRHDKYHKIGCGYPPLIKEITDLPTKDLKWFFSGQITHERREECINQLANLEDGELLRTKGFTQGFDQKEYFTKMARAKVSPCPSGPVTVDTFRAYEALELGSVPIVDTQTPKEDWAGFWEWLFEEPVPFPTIINWESLPGYIQETAAKYPDINNKCQSFWIRYKNKLKHKIFEQIFELTKQRLQPQITVIIPVSPIPSHPETFILEETIETIRHNLPASEVILTFDGVRPEQSERLPAYQEHIRRILWKCRSWGNIRPFIFDEQIHQIGMMRRIIDEIRTDKILYVEQDTPIVKDELIEWDKLSAAIDDGTSNLIRLHFEGTIPEAHKYLMIGEPENGLQKTVQWSQRPHLASTAFYRRIISRQFSAKANCFIEDLMYGRVLQDWNRDGVAGWNQWRLHIYHPNNTNIKRSYNLDGRQGAKKYDDKQIW